MPASARRRWGQCELAPLAVRGRCAASVPQTEMLGLSDHALRGLRPTSHCATQSRSYWTAERSSHGCPYNKARTSATSRPIWARKASKDGNLSSSRMRATKSMAMRSP
jgi:hypothetical protein